jgi:drug/metabolite transporter (DMT)-like permease
MGNAAVKPVLFALCAAALFGVSTPCAKVMLDGIGPVTLAALLYLGSGLGLGLFALLPGRPEAGIARADLPWLAGSVLAGGVLAPVVLMAALAVTPAATASLLLTVETAATALVALLVFGEPVGRRVGAAVALVTVAVALLSWEGNGNYGLSAGALGVVLACFLWGLDNNLTARISAKDPVVITAVKGMGAGLFTLALAAVVGETLPALPVSGPALVLGFVCYGLSLVLFVMAVRGMGAARTSALFAASPFVGVAFSVAALGERPDPLFVPALLVMGAGAFLLVGERHGHRHHHAALTHDHRHRHDDLHHAHLHGPGEAVPPGGEHAHPHRHDVVDHVHPHTPDIHHRHRHEDED